MNEDRNNAIKSDRPLMVTNRRRLLTLGSTAAALAWAGPKLGWIASAQAATPPSKPTGLAKIGLSQEPTVFMPPLAHLEVDEGVYFNLFSTLWCVDEDGQFQPDLVAEVPTLENGGISADGLHWHLKLNDKAKWHDGTPFSADDVKFNIELMQDPKFLAGRRDGVELIEDVKILGPSELTFSLKKPYAALPSILSWTFLVPKHLIENESDINNPVKFLSNPIGTGAFKWVERVPGDHITLGASGSYHRKGPYLEKLIIKYVPDLTVLYTQFQTGDIDYVGQQGITPDHYEEAKTLTDRSVAATPQPYIENIGFNLGNPRFQDPAVREALYLATDKKSIIEQIYYGLPIETESYLPQQSWAFNPDLPKHEFDPEKAKKLLDEAGWKPGADGVREKNGMRLEFTNSTTAGNHVREQAQQLLQQTWGDIGAKMTIQNLPPAVMWGDYYMNSQFDTIMVGIDFMVGPDPDATHFFAESSIPAKGGNGENTTQYTNPEVEKLLSEGGSTVDVAKRKAAYFKMQELTRKDLPYLPIFQYIMVEGVAGKLEGFKPNINVQENCWNAYTWFWAS